MWGLCTCCFSVSGCSEEPVILISDFSIISTYLTCEWAQVNLLLHLRTLLRRSAEPSRCTNKSQSCVTVVYTEDSWEINLGIREHLSGIHPALPAWKMEVQIPVLCSSEILWTAPVLTQMSAELLTHPRLLRFCKPV